MEQKYNKRKDKHEWTQMDKIERDCIWVILPKEVGPTFFKFTVNRLDKGLFAQNHPVYDVTIILLLKEFHVSIFKFSTHDQPKDTP